MKFTKKEQEVLDVFWEMEKPLSVKDITENNPSLNKSTVAILVRKLHEKGYLKVDSIQKVAKTYAQYYVPTVSKEEFLTKDFTKATFKNLITNFIKKEKNHNELNELMELIQNQLDNLEK
ncbi:BlaI/MecI/CopY family transcriptional regulator [Enterococcus cecorum]|uniref:BlaI/MecI/CopY family transcriptional regulator n=1 Tax=Enterococcus cecorum TaxID=44008 RepID=A0A7X9RLL9_9ENTE|nr:BlaI/MecI/CopY family transcriptional regulator [Enterococcus cecorum]NME50697.1 BlaI/MecI/CopY family transcriptional regulator [Enterococcus cecorum]